MGLCNCGTTELWPMISPVRLWGNHYSRPVGLGVTRRVTPNPSPSIAANRHTQAGEESFLLRLVGCNSALTTQLIVI